MSRRFSVNSEEDYSACREVPCGAVDKKLDYLNTNKVSMKLFVVFLSACGIFAMFMVTNSLSIRTSVAQIAEYVKYQGIQITDIKTSAAIFEKDIKNLERSLYSKPYREE